MISGCSKSKVSINLGRGVTTYVSNAVLPPISTINLTIIGAFAVPVRKKMLVALGGIFASAIYAPAPCASVPEVSTSAELVPRPTVP